MTYGEDEDAGPQVWRADFCRSPQIPLRIVPEVGQGPENSSQPSAVKSALCVVHHFPFSRQ